jgi:hypothetical protein
MFFTVLVLSHIETVPLFNARIAQSVRQLLYGGNFNQSENILECRLPPGYLVMTHVEEFLMARNSKLFCLQFNALDCGAKAIGKRSLRLKPRHSLLFGEASELGGNKSSEIQQPWKSTVEICSLKVFKEGVGSGSAKGKPLPNPV